MPVDPPGSVPDAAAAGADAAAPASGARVSAPRAGTGAPPGPAASGPRRPPRPDRPTPNGPGFGRGTKPSTPLPTGAADDDPTGEFDDLGPGVAAPGAPKPRPAGTRPPATTTQIPGKVRGRGRRRGRRVRRVVRRIDLWSVLKLSLVVYTCLYAAVMATLAAVWALAYSSGSIDKLESFLGDVGLDNFHFYGDRMFRACAAVGAVGVLSGTVITVLTTALINVISEVTGGIRLVVIEEDVPAG